MIFRDILRKFGESDCPGDGFIEAITRRGMVNEELCDIPGTIRASKSLVQLNALLIVSIR
jgi:hypothetical protein